MKPKFNESEEKFIQFIHSTTSKLINEFLDRERNHHLMEDLHHIQTEIFNRLTKKTEQKPSPDELAKVQYQQSAGNKL